MPYFTRFFFPQLYHCHNENWCWIFPWVVLQMCRLSECKWHIFRPTFLIFDQCVSKRVLAFNRSSISQYSVKIFTFYCSYFICVVKTSWFLFILINRMAFNTSMWDAYKYTYQFRLVTCDNFEVAKLKSRFSHCLKLGLRPCSLTAEPHVMLLNTTEMWSMRSCGLQVSWDLIV